MNKNLYVHLWNTVTNQAKSSVRGVGNEVKKENKFINISRKNEWVVEQRDNENNIYSNLYYGYTRDQ